jgi:hypothetical protein
MAHIADGALRHLSLDNIAMHSAVASMSKHDPEPHGKKYNLAPTNVREIHSVFI